MESLPDRRAPRLFVVHAAEDSWFVDGFLRKALGLPDEALLRSSQLEPGAPILRELERGALSVITAVVMSPHFLSSPWAQLASALAAHRSVESSAEPRATSLVPLLLADCELPLFTRAAVPLDFRDPIGASWEREAARLRALLHAPVPREEPVPCPYPGMRPFSSECAEHFHGRDQEIAELMARLRDGQRELYVIGPSGSGKSSLIAAGLIPQLRREPACAGGPFAIRQLRPGVDPMAALAGALDHAFDHARPEEPPPERWIAAAIGRLTRLPDGAPEQRLLLFVDQLEELFTTSEPARRSDFLAALRELRRHPHVALVLTLRADFYGALMESPLWDDLDGRLSRLDIAPLRGDKLRRAIEAPARRLHVYFEPVLLERLLHEVAHEPGALPLLQDTLLELWHRRARNLLRLADYLTMLDGVHTGLALTVRRRADAALDLLSPPRRQIARRVFLRLVQFGEGAAPTRRQQPRVAFSAAGDAPDEVDAVVHHLASHRLITTSEGDVAEGWMRVDLAHEVLLTAWPTLGEWIRARRHDEQRRRVLEAKADEWFASGRGTSRLLDEEELREAHAWLAKEDATELGVSEAILTLLDKSRAAHDASQQEREARAREMAAKIAETLQLVIRQYISKANELLTQERPAQALPYLVAAREAGIDTIALRMLFRRAASGLPRLHLSHQDKLTAVAWSPDGKRLATASHDGTARLWDPFTGESTCAPLRHDGPVFAISWSPDGRHLATASFDQTARIWDAATGELFLWPLEHGKLVTTLAWSANGQHLATASGHSARVWSTATGHLLSPPFPHQGDVMALAWNPDGNHLATASQDGMARVFRPESGALMLPPLEHDGSVLALAWHPQGTSLATSTQEAAAYVWDMSSGQLRHPPIGYIGGGPALAWDRRGLHLALAISDTAAGLWHPDNQESSQASFEHEHQVTALAWSPDDTCLATASEDNSARIWSSDRGFARSPSLRHRRRVNAVAWSPDGEHLATASDDRTARVWDIAVACPQRPRLLKTGQRATSVAWTDGGARLVTSSGNHVAQHWDATTGRALASAPELPSNAVAGAWSADGRRFAAAAEDRRVYLWSPDPSTPLLPPLDTGSEVVILAWRPDGRALATADQEGQLCVHALDATRATLPLALQPEGLSLLSWSPDGRLLATTDLDGNVRVWDSLDARLISSSIAHHNQIVAMAWSATGKLLATGSIDSTARIWDPLSGAPLSPPLEHWRGVTAVAWNAEGNCLVTTSGDRTARIWSATGAPLSPPLEHERSVSSLAWSPDGKRLATISGDKAFLWDPFLGAKLTAPLDHERDVSSLAWSPDGKHLATIAGLVHLWDVSWDTGTLADWRAALQRCDYQLSADGVLVPREE